MMNQKHVKANIEVNNGERGAALILALLTMALLLALTMGISLTAVSELGVSRTYSTQTVALQAAEAGLNHAASLVSNYTGPDFTTLLALRTAPTSDAANYLNPAYNPFTAANAGQFAAGSVMITSEHATRGFQLRDGITGAVVPDAYYRVTVIDDEPNPTSGPEVPNFNPGNSYREVVTPNENNSSIDKNNRIVLYSVGSYANTSVTLEGWVAFLPFPALSANNNIEISGSADIEGAYGGVHSNSNLIASGGAWRVEQTATASGILQGSFAGQVGGFYGGGQPPLDLPPFVTRDPLTSGGPYTPPRIQDFLIRRADVLLIDPNFANNAHGSDETDTGSPATRQLKAIANRLNIDYATLASQLDSTPGGNVQQTGAVAISVTRTVPNDPNSQGIPTRIDMSTVGWSYGGGTWGISSNSAAGHTVYVIGTNNYDTSNQNLTSSGSSADNGGDILLNGNVGPLPDGPDPGNDPDPLPVTMFATGSIEVRGNVSIGANLQDVQTPFLPPFISPDILMVATQDVWVNGDFAANIAFTGVSFAGEAVKLSGNGSINGQMIAYNWPHVSGSPVSALNEVTGSFLLTLNQGDSIGRIRLFSWRQIKQ
ncbi:MAG TPA: hypothetical protein VNO70_01955 [Blastocatellia bacterium]|nr:hypothetical protein [Blastocatellia bacterium]